MVNSPLVTFPATQFIKIAALSVVSGNVASVGFSNGLQYYFQNDGNFCGYNTTGAAVACTMSNFPSNNLSMTFGNGNIVFYSNGYPYWSTNTPAKAANSTLVFSNGAPWFQIVGPNGTVYYDPWE